MIAEAPAPLSGSLHNAHHLMPNTSRLVQSQSEIPKETPQLKPFILFFFNFSNFTEIELISFVRVLRRDLWHPRAGASVVSQLAGNKASICIHVGRDFSFHSWSTAC